MNSIYSKPAVKIFLVAAGLTFTAACTSQESQETASQAPQEAASTQDQPAATSPPTTSKPMTSCAATEPLLYQTDTFSSFTEDKMRGAGVVSIQLDLNDRLDIYYLDDAPYTNLVYNEDNTFYTTDLPRKVVARGLVPEADVAQFDFDAEAPSTDPEYLIIYLNKEKRKVAKADVKYTFSTWEKYLKNQNIRLKDCNLLPHAPQSKNQVFEVTAIKNDSIQIKSSKDCQGDLADYEPLEGWVQWKKADVLTVEFAPCS
ncbi:hypothetical protein [Rufibacter ruber]|uniref:hypothetical protein n=1 Tax=Rufibacter ruber TaxID=1783499 RepID=UPI000AB7EA56|nr:hypothetical protein [Rufibacter ruber]